MHRSSTQALVAVTLAVALSPRSAVAEELELVSAPELQQKFDFGDLGAITNVSAWKENLDAAKELTLKASQQAVDASTQVGKQVGSQDIVGEVRNMSSTFTTGLTENGKRTAFYAVLTYLGKCPSMYAALPKVPEILAPKLAEALQSHPEDPSTSREACTDAVKTGIRSALGEHMTTHNEQERNAVEWIAMDRASQVCTDTLMSALKTTECIRHFYPAPYMLAVRDELLLKVLLDNMLQSELDKVCWGKQHSQKQIGLFTTAGRGDVVVSDTAEHPALVAPHRAPWLVAALLAVAGLLVMVRRSHRVGTAGEELPADDVESRLVESIE